MRRMVRMEEIEMRGVGGLGKERGKREEGGSGNILGLE